MSRASADREGILYLLRHGRTAANAQRYAGWEDEPLDEVGRQQAEAIRRHLEGRRIEAVYASPLSRAQDTARPLAEALGLAVETRRSLIELNFGAFQGLDKRAHPLRLRRSHVVEPLPGGESLADLRRRALAFAGEIAPRLGRGEAIAVVSHYWTSRALLAVLHGRPLEGLFDGLGYKPATGSVLEVRCRAGKGGCMDVAGTRLVLGGEAEAGP